MSRFRWLISSLWHKSAEAEFAAWIASQPLPEIVFLATTDVTSPPLNEAVQPGTFYRVMRNEQPKWALFQCPCGCSTVITLSLQQAHRPHWVVHSSKEHRPSMRPSVWRDIGCFSHFWVEDGRVYWCVDSGSPPWSKH